MATYLDRLIDYDTWANQGCSIPATTGRGTGDLTDATEDGEMSGHAGNVIIREAHTIWREQGGWFDARWHFSFDRYHDPEQMGVGALRVFNDDRIVAGAEWPLHPHRDIESLDVRRRGRFPARRLAREQRPPRARGGPGDDLFAPRGPAFGEERLAERGDALHPVLDPAERKGSRDAGPATPVRARRPDGPLAPDHGTRRHGWPRSVAGRVGTCRPPDRPGAARP